MIRLCIFDLDGTLVDSLKDLANAMNTALEAQGFGTHDVQKYRFLVGSGLSVLADRAALAPNERYTPEVKEKILADFSSYYELHCLDNTVPFKGVDALLKELKKRGVLFAVNSNKPDAFTKKIVKALLPEHDFSVICGKRDGFERKPSPDGANHIMYTVSASPEETLYIGDSDVDVLTAKNAGISFCGVSWGFRGKDELRSAGADFIADSVQDILDLTESL